MFENSFRLCVFVPGLGVFAHALTWCEINDDGSRARLAFEPPRPKTAMAVWRANEPRVVWLDARNTHRLFARSAVDSYKWHPLDTQFFYDPDVQQRRLRSTDDLVGSLLLRDPEANAFAGLWKLHFDSCPPFGRHRVANAHSYLHVRSPRPRRSPNVRSLSASASSTTVSSVARSPLSRSQPELGRARRWPKLRRKSIASIQLHLLNYFPLMRFVREHKCVQPHATLVCFTLTVLFSCLFRYAGQISRCDCGR